MAKRRGNGEGSIYRRNDGRWCGKYVAVMPTGEMKTGYVYGKTRKEVAGKLRAALAQREAGLAGWTWK